MKFSLTLFTFFSCLSLFGQNEFVDEELGYKIVNTFIDSSTQKKVGVLYQAFDMTKNDYFGTHYSTNCTTPLALKNSIHKLTKDFTSIDIENQCFESRRLWKKEMIERRLLWTSKPVKTNFVIGILHRQLTYILRIFDPPIIYGISWPIRLNNDTYAIQYYTINRSSLILTPPKLSFVKYTATGGLTILKEE